MSNELVDRRREGAKRLLRLFDREEIASLCGLLTLAPDSEVDTVIQALAELPRFRALQLALKAAEPTVIMLQNITSFLEKHGISARTTGFALALGNPARPGSVNRIDLSAQEVAQVCSFSLKKLRSIGDDPFKDAYQCWLSLSKEWGALLTRSEPDIVSGRLDVVRSHIARKSVYHDDEDDTDYNAQSVLRHLLFRVKGLEKVLTEIKEQDRFPPIDSFLRDIRKLLHAAERSVFRQRNSDRSRTWRNDAEPDEATVLRYVSEEFLDTLDRVSEDVRAIADLTEDEKLLDILRVDLWSARPQLYEAWLLTRILNWIETRGNQVVLLQLEPDESGRAVWHLSYSRASKPCAKIVSDERSTFVFFQLYRASGDMPDLCVLSDSSPIAEPLWALDAKHSAQGGYNLRSYQSTATRYHDSFGAPLSLVVEYFPRTDLSQENPIVFGDGTALVKDARPGGSGVTIVFEFLRKFYPAREIIVVCIDYSSSFRERRDQAFREAVKKLCSLTARVIDTYVCFAGNAVAVKGMAILQNADQNKQLPEVNLQDGTSLQEMIRELKRLAADITISRVIVVGDGKFSEPKWFQCVEKEVGCMVDLCS
jgi:hypothetical protein